MMRTVLSGSLVFAVVFGVTLAAPAVHAETECASKVAAVIAAEPQADTEVNEGDCAGETSFSINGKNTGVNIKDLAVDLLRIASALAGILIVGGVVYGGIVYSSSKGNPAGVQKARKIIGNSLLALAMYAMMFAAINFLLPGRVLF